MNCTTSAVAQSVEKTDDELPNPAPKQEGIVSIDKIAKISGLDKKRTKTNF